jgi:NTP pyrophosphatase (non-canonical NTP hydrolase)
LHSRNVVDEKERRLLQEKQKQMKRELLETNVIKWAADRNLLQPENTKNQALKTVSEVGELCDAIIKNNRAEIIDAIGDVEVCLTILKEQLCLRMDTPLRKAYDEIKDRKGKTVDGTFIKEG